MIIFPRMSRESTIDLGGGRTELTFCRPAGTAQPARWNRVVIGWVEPASLGRSLFAPLLLESAYVSRQQ